MSKININVSKHNENRFEKGRKAALYRASLYREHSAAGVLPLTVRLSLPLDPTGSNRFSERSLHYQYRHLPCIPKQVNSALVADTNKIGSIHQKNLIPRLQLRLSGATWCNVRDEHAVVRGPIRISSRADASHYVKTERRVAPYGDRDHLQVIRHFRPSVLRSRGGVSRLFGHVLIVRRRGHHCARTPMLHRRSRGRSMTLVLSR